VIAAQPRAGIALRRALEIAVTAALTCVLALLLVIPGMRRQAQEDLLKLDPLVMRSAEEYLDPRPVPEAPSPEDPPEPVEPGSGRWRDDFDDLAAWKQWRGPRPAVREGMLQIISQPDHWPVFYQAKPWLIGEADIELRVRCQGSLFEMGVAEAVGSPWRELGGRLNCPRVVDGLFVYLNRSSSPHVAGLDHLAGDVLQVQTQGPVERRRLDEFSVLRLELRKGSAALFVDGGLCVRESFEWREKARRLYIGSAGGDTWLDYITITPVD